MTGTTSRIERSDGAPGGQRAGAKRLIASQEIPGALPVYLHVADGRFVLYAETEHLQDGPMTATTLPDLYRWLRARRKMPIAFHVPTLDLALDLVDGLSASERHYGRLSVVHAPAMPPVPRHPDQDDIDLLRDLEFPTNTPCRSRSHQFRTAPDHRFGVACLP